MSCVVKKKKKKQTNNQKKHLYSFMYCHNNTKKYLKVR